MFNNPMALSAQEFDRRHGEDYVLVNGIMYFKNGAWRHSDPRGVRVEPEADPKALAKAQLTYCQQKIVQLLDRAKEINLELQRLAAYGQLTLQHAQHQETQLLEIKAAVQKLRQELAQATERFTYPGMGKAEIAQRKQVQASLARSTSAHDSELADTYRRALEIKI